MFLDTNQFSFVRDLEASWTMVRDECLALPESTFEPWVQREMYGEGWSVFGFVAFGNRIEEASQSCPRTAALVEHEAWNRSTKTRVVLLLDFLRPGFTSAAADEAPPEVEALIQQRTGGR